MAHAAAQRQHQPRDRAAAVGVQADHLARVADAGRRDRVPTVLREAEHCGDPARSGLRSDRQRPPAEPVDAQHRDVVLRVERDCVRVQGRARPARPHDGVVLARDDVRVGHHDPGPRDPARAFDAQPAGRPKHLHDAVGSALDVGVAGDLRRRRRDVRLTTLRVTLVLRPLAVSLAALIHVLILVPVFFVLMKEIWSVFAIAT